MTANGLMCVLGALGVFGTLALCTGDDGSWIHPKCEPLASPHMGPYVNLGDGSVLAVAPSEALVSKDEGRTWKSYPLFKDTEKFLARPERALLRTRNGVVIMGFLNQR